MKYISAILLSLFVIGTLTSQASPEPPDPDSEHYLPNIEDEYHGTYFNNGFLELLKKTGSIASSFTGLTGPIIYMVQKNIIYTNDTFYDGYAVKNKDYTNWKFYKENDINYLSDNKLNIYRRIFLDKYYNGEFEKYFMSQIILSNNYKKISKRINLNKDGRIIYDGQEFELEIVYSGYQNEEDKSKKPDLIFNNINSRERGSIHIYYNNLRSVIEYVYYDIPSKSIKTIKI